MGQSYLGTDPELRSPSTRQTLARPILQRLGHCRSAQTLRLQLADCLSLDRFLPALTDAIRFGSRDAFYMPLLSQICLKVGEDREHVQDRLHQRQMKYQSADR